MSARDTGGQQQRGRAKETEPEVEDTVDASVSEKHEKMSDDIDAILGDIDEVLEVNSEEFVRQYVQKGGQ